MLPVKNVSPIPRFLLAIPDLSRDIQPGDVELTGVEPDLISMDKDLEK